MAVPEDAADEDANDEAATGYMIRLTDDEDDLTSWRGEYLRGVGLQGHHSLMVDLGSGVNIVGGDTLQGMSDTAREYGYTTKFRERERPLRFGGVGLGGSRCTHEATVPLAIKANGQSAMHVPLQMNVAKERRDSVICMREG